MLFFGLHYCDNYSKSCCRNVFTGALVLILNFVNSIDFIQFFAAHSINHENQLFRGTIVVNVSMNPLIEDIFIYGYT